MKKLSLDIDYQSEYEMIGICSHLKDYRLSWLINEKLGFHLKKMEDLEFCNDKKQKPNLFSIYYYYEGNYLTYYFVSNRSQKGILIPEQKHADYFLLVKGSVNKQRIKEIVKEIKIIANILTVYSVDLSSIKNTDNILSDIELHIYDILNKKKVKYKKSKKTR